MAKAKTKKKPAAIDPLDIELLRKIEAQENRCQESEVIVLEAKEQLKRAKELHGGNEFELRRLARARQNDAKRPLFNQQPKKKGGRKPKAAAAPAQNGDLLGAPPGWQPQGDAWKAQQLSGLKLSGTILTALETAKLRTMGELCDFCRSGKKLTDIEGLTVPEAGKLETALARFWAAQQIEAAKQEVKQ